MYEKNIGRYGDIRVYKGGMNVWFKKLKKEKIGNYLNYVSRYEGNSFMLGNDKIILNGSFYIRS